MKNFTVLSPCLGWIAVGAFTPLCGLQQSTLETVDRVATVAHVASTLNVSATTVFGHNMSVSESLDEVVQTVCVRCHNDERLRGNLSLEDFEVTAADQKPEIAEKMIRKLRAGMMPPPGTRRPAEDTLLALAETLEQIVDERADQNPNPGGRTFQRLNRPEYERAIKDLLGLDIDAGNWLPLDQMSANFDNIADVQAFSPTLVDSYLNGASDISRMAIGDRDAPPINTTYKNSPYVSQHPWDHVEGAPYGTRGGMVTDHVFPADAEYVFELTFASGNNARLEDVDISVGGERVSLLHYTRRGGGADERGFTPIRTDPVFIRAGQHKVSVAFIRKTEGPYEDLIRPHEWSNAGGGSGGAGITTLPHLQSLVIGGPYNVTGVSDSHVRQRIFTCRPTSPSEEQPCARRILTELTTKAYRRPVMPNEIDGLMSFYATGSEQGGFEVGIRMALEAILVSPYFVLRLEREPANVAEGQNYRIDGLDLATRLSFFLWGLPPDDELRTVALEGRLSDPAELDKQVHRMIADARSEALGSRFVAQWLRLQDLHKVRPDPNFYPNFDENLAIAMQRETEVFFSNLVHEEKSMLELFSADYTFVNERLARHYDFPDVTGERFRRVDYPDGSRVGLLGHGSVLVLTSMANRTSPVLRGKWVMEVLLGTPPPPPPPGIPDLDETEGSKDGRLLTTRERMELHRASPACRSCHRFMDPIGLALDQFDVTGKWRVRENGMPVDTRGDFYDGTLVSSPRELVDALLKRPLPLVRNFTENLMAYALGRRVEYYDQPAIRAIVEDAASDGYKISSLILGVAQSDAFQMKRVVPVTVQEEVSNDGR